MRRTARADLVNEVTGEEIIGTEEAGSRDTHPDDQEGKNSGRGSQRRVDPSSQKGAQPEQCQPKEAVSVPSKQRALH